MIDWIKNLFKGKVVKKPSGKTCGKCGSSNLTRRASGIVQCADCGSTVR